ncbi:MAG: hypothetical protein ACYS0I_11535 [Planctomycetota bacterium]|jgi:hypothetical protein
MGGTGFSPICFEHDVIQRLKNVLKKADAAIVDITSFFIVLKPVLSPTNQSFLKPPKTCDIFFLGGRSSHEMQL